MMKDLSTGYGELDDWPTLNQLREALDWLYEHNGNDGDARIEVRAQPPYPNDPRGSSHGWVRFTQRGAK